MTALDVTVMRGPDVDYGTQTVSERIAHWASATPDSAALELTGKALSFGELEKQVQSLARWMRHAGVTPGSIVALHFERSVELVVGMLAAWRARAAFLPLEPSWPVTRKRAVLEEARPALLLNGQAGMTGLPVDMVQSVTLADIDLESIDDSAAGGSFGEPPGLNELAYVLYTSGSTGTPKGVMVEHSQLLNYVAAVSDALSLPRVKRWGLVGSLAADLGYTALFGGLFNGACIVIADTAEARDAEAFARFIRERRIGALKIVPSHLDALLESAHPCLPRTLVLGEKPRHPRCSKESGEWRRTARSTTTTARRRPRSAY